MIHNTRGLGIIFPRLFFGSTPSIAGGTYLTGVPFTSAYTSGILNYTYDGYFNDNLNFFNTSTVVSGIYASNVNIVNARNMRSELMFGYFKPPATGLITISVTSDDASYVWLGDTALSPTTANALIKLPGIHNVFTLNSRASADVLLYSDSLYALRIYYGNSTVTGSFTMSVKAPGTPLMYNLSANLFH